MLDAIARRIFGSANDRYVKSLNKTVADINALEPDVQKLSDEELRARPGWLKGRLAAGETLDQILPDAFAPVREAGRRTPGARPFDVQLLARHLPHRGMVADIKTSNRKPQTGKACGRERGC